ncbi:MAG TPA: glycosyltransferase [Acidimicrobiales bacterium]|nr:glycosyltransferase [Acidimicrobiales bacterium]
MRIDQLLAAAAPGDAVTASALGNQRLLRTLGPSEVFATFVDPALAGRVHALTPAALPPAGPDDVLLVHVSIGAPELMAVLEDRPERVGLVYHNMSPAEAFAPFEPALAALLRLGRRQLPRLVERASFAVADSAFNAAELDALGLRRIEVVPPASDLDGLLAAGPDEAPAPWPGDGPAVLMVAQVAPHKRQHRLAGAFHVLSTWHRPDAALLLVGPSHTPAYDRAVRAHVDRLALTRAALTGRVPLTTLAAAYRRAAVFVTLSAHEGFCVPLVEAMAFGVPVVAVAAGAVPETAGDAALLLDDDAPELVAEAVLAVLDDTTLREAMVARGAGRVEAYRAASAPERALAVFEGFL